MINHYIEVGDKRYELDHKGYLTDMSQWDAQIRDWFAGREGVGLTDDHHRVIEYLRDYFAERKAHPGGRLITKALAEIFDPGKGSGEYFNELFPGGVHQAFKIAGLPLQHSCC